MKFYYKGQLVRTSKTHTYNWAILEEKDDGTLKVYGYRAERAAADTELTQVIRRGHPYARVVPLDTEPNPPALTFDQFMALARENYGKGGDGYVECWDDRTFAYFVKEFGPITMLLRRRWIRRTKSGQSAMLLRKENSDHEEAEHHL